MHKAEQQALYSAVQAFVGSWWNGSDLYPDPCGWTPIQGVYCDLYNDFWYVSVINIGPLYDNSLRCTTNIPEFSHHLFKLKHLKVLSFFSCFLSPSQNPITISTSNWEKLANSLESWSFDQTRSHWNSSKHFWLPQKPAISSSARKWIRRQLA
ncbi:piriformospora indica-insensitive protein 2-like [Prunus yedoensis var. nudiflora]|uniref:Piriformospora indica-insensitive protein 2-like n=1 Tax=Prunus yedoensis var. nudiflora TaxID=2094558 RepID=A0A314XNP8_PRUYE|nr:piriformospora indica-insensitive protein 2-like [Prunus yedoensis var. nudiflora]